jgi:poly(3-hydroxyalkanoate) depolymerase
MSASPQTVRGESGAAPSAYSEIRQVEVDGQVLRVARRRSDCRPARPLLIFNGIGAHLEMLEPFVKALQDIEIVTFDVPGAGDSPAPTLPYRYRHVARLADHLMSYLGYDGEIDVLGVSWGGGLAQQYAHHYPDRCRRLILAGTSFGQIMIPGRVSVMTKLVSSMMTKFVNPRRYYDRSYLKRVIPELYGGLMRTEPDLLDHMSSHVRRANGRGYVYQLLAISGWSSLPWLHRLNQDTLIMAGLDDPIIPLPNAKIFKYLIPQSELVVFDDGHLFLITSASKVAPVVQRFLAATTP